MGAGSGADRSGFSLNGSLRSGGRAMNSPRNFPAKSPQIRFIWNNFKKHLHNPWRCGIVILPLHGFFVVFSSTEFFVVKNGHLGEGPQYGEEGGYFPAEKGLSEPGRSIKIPISGGAIKWELKSQWHAQSANSAITTLSKTRKTILTVLKWTSTAVFAESTRSTGKLNKEEAKWKF